MTVHELQGPNNFDSNGGVQGVQPMTESAGQSRNEHGLYCMCIGRLGV